MKFDFGDGKRQWHPNSAWFEPSDELLQLLCLDRNDDEHHYAIKRVGHQLGWASRSVRTIAESPISNLARSRWPLPDQRNRLAVALFNVAKTRGLAPEGVEVVDGTLYRYVDGQGLGAEKGIQSFGSPAKVTFIPGRVGRVHFEDPEVRSAMEGFEEDDWRVLSKSERSELERLDRAVSRAAKLLDELSEGARRILDDSGYSAWRSFVREYQDGPERIYEMTPLPWADPGSARRQVRTNLDRIRSGIEWAMGGKKKDPGGTPLKRELWSVCANTDRLVVSALGWAVRETPSLLLALPSEADGEGGDLSGLTLDGGVAAGDRRSIERARKAFRGAVRKRRRKALPIIADLIGANVSPSRAEKVFSSDSYRRIATPWDEPDER